jgi:hypothetical protein
MKKTHYELGSALFVIFLFLCFYKVADFLVEKCGLFGPELKRSHMQKIIISKGNDEENGEEEDENLLTPTLTSVSVSDTEEEEHPSYIQTFFKKNIFVIEESVYDSDD